MCNINKHNLVAFIFIFSYYCNKIASAYSNKNMKFFKSRLDYFGIGASTFCAIHCLITPILIASLPFASLTLLEEKAFEIGLLIMSLLIGLVSLISSYFKRHRKILPIILGSIGFSIFILGKIISIEDLEIILSIVGGSFVVMAHLFNIRFIKQAKS